MKKRVIAIVALAALAAGGASWYAHSLQIAHAETMHDVSQDIAARKNLQTALKQTPTQYMTEDVMAKDDNRLFTVARYDTRGMEDYRNTIGTKNANSWMLWKVNDVKSQLARHIAAQRADARNLKAVTAILTASHTTRLLNDSRGTLNGTINAAHRVLDASNNNVDNNNSRTRLTNDINAASDVVKRSDRAAIDRANAALTGDMNTVNNDVSTHVKEVAEAVERENGAPAAASSGSAAGGGVSYNSSNGTYTYRNAAGNTVNISAGSCNATSTYYCQDDVDRGGFTAVNYNSAGGLNGYNSTVYAAHNGDGGAQVLGWRTGQKVTMNGHTYTVTGRTVVPSGSAAPRSGTYALTCLGTAPGSGSLLVSLQ